MSVSESIGLFLIASVALVCTWAWIQKLQVEAHVSDQAARHWRKRCDDLQIELEAIQRDCNAKDAQQTDLMKKIEESAAIVNRWRSERNSLSDERDELARKVHSLIKEKDELADRIAELLEVCRNITAERDENQRWLEIYQADNASAFLHVRSAFEGLIRFLIAHLRVGRPPEPVGDHSGETNDLRVRLDVAGGRLCSGLEVGGGDQAG